MVSLRPRFHRILLVDDDEMSLELIALMLESGSYVVTRMDSGAAALEHLQGLAPEVYPHILLLDLQMPGLSGSELAEKCRALLLDSSLILAMSATRPPASRLMSYDGFVSKPFDIEAFEEAVGKVAGDPGSSRGIRDAGPYGRDLDDTVYSKLAGMMPATRLEEIYSTCLADTVRRIPLMRTYAAVGNLEEIRRMAHAIKGGGSMIGARCIADAAGELELGEYATSDVPRLLLDLSSACERLGSILLLPEIRQSKGKA